MRACVHVWVGVCRGEHVKVSGWLVGISTLLLCGTWEWNAGHWTGTFLSCWHYTQNGRTWSPYLPSCAAVPHHICKTAFFFFLRKVITFKDGHLDLNNSMTISLVYLVMWSNWGITSWPLDLGNWTTVPSLMKLRTNESPFLLLRRAEEFCLH